MTGWMIARRSLPKAHDWLHRAVELGRTMRSLFSRGGHALAHLGGRSRRGVARIDRALVLNPNLATAWYLSGFLKIARRRT